jgi:hypothetical protein
MQAISRVLSAPIIPRLDQSENSQPRLRIKEMKFGEAPKHERPNQPRTFVQLLADIKASPKHNLDSSLQH